MFRLAVVGVAIVFGLSVLAGMLLDDDGAGGPTAAPTPQELRGPTEESLRTWLAEYWFFYQRGEYAKMYTLLSDETREQCSFADFAQLMEVSRALLGEDFSEAEPVVDAVSVDNASVPPSA